jgi:MFS family permease
MVVFSAVVLPLVARLNLEMSQVVGLSFWMYLLFGFSALPWGLLGDRWQGNALMVIMFVGSGVSGLAAAYFMNSPALLSLALAGIGFFSGIYHPIGMGLISKGVRRISLAMGYNAAFGGLGLVVGPLLTGILNWLAGPAAAFLFLGTLNLGGVVLMALLPLGSFEPEPKSTAESKSPNGMLGAFLILLVATGLAGIAFSGATLILPAYIELKSHGILDALYSVWGRPISGNLLATTITSLIYTTGMVGQYLGGHVAERTDQRYSYLVFHAICIIPAFLMAFTQNVTLVGLAVVYFLFQLGMQPMENTLVALYSPRNLHHSAFGLKFVLTFGVGSLGVKMVQWIDAAWGIEAVFVALGVISVMLVMSILALIRWTAVREARAELQAAEV